MNLIGALRRVDGDHRLHRAQGVPAGRGRRRVAVRAGRRSRSARTRRAARPGSRPRPGPAHHGPKRCHNRPRASCSVEGEYAATRASANGCGVPCSVHARSRPGSPVRASLQSITPLTRPSATSRCSGPGPRAPGRPGSGSRWRRAGPAPSSRRSAGSSGSTRSRIPVSPPAARRGWRRRPAPRCRGRRPAGCRAGPEEPTDRVPSAAVSAPARTARPARTVPRRSGSPSSTTGTGTARSRRGASLGSNRVSASRCAATSGRRGRRSSQRPSTRVASLSQPCRADRSASRARTQSPSRPAVSGITGVRGRRASRPAAPASSRPPGRPPRPAADRSVPRSCRGRRGTTWVVGVVGLAQRHQHRGDAELLVRLAPGARQRVLPGEQHPARGEVEAARVDVLGVGAPVHVHAPSESRTTTAVAACRRFSARIRDRGAEPPAVPRRRTARRSRPSPHPAGPGGVGPRAGRED